MLSRTNSQFLTASVTEFISVWAIGGDASLNLTTKGGFTTIGFNCTIGVPGAHHSLPPTPPSAPSFPPPPPRRPRHRGPAELERNKQRAARHQATKAASHRDMSCTTSVADSVSDTIAPTPVITAPVITPAVTPRLTSDKGTQSESFPTEPVMDNLDNTKCDQCDFISKSSNGLKIHTRNRHRISQIDGHNEDSESEEIIEKELSFNCDDCECTSKEEPDLRCHAEKEHFQCSDCDMKLTSKSSLKLHKKEKHCDGCGKVVDSYWHHKYLPRGDIYDVCGPDCYVEFFNEVVNPPPPPGRMWA